MIEQLIEWDYNVLLAINGLGAPALDDYFWVVTKKWTWIPFYAALLYVIYKNETSRFQINQFKIGGLLIISIALIILLADQTASGFSKPYFERLRPSHDPKLQDVIHLYYHSGGDYYRGGTYGFFSSHAANSFAIAAFVSLVLKNKFITATVFFWALLVSYSRVYLGVHFPGDIICGGAVGVVYGIAVGKLYKFTKTKLL